MAYFIVITIITLAYSTIILSFLVGWLRQKKYKKGQFDPSLLYASIVIAAKNEERNIPGLLQSLKNQTIDPKQIEIIIVNDHSDDKTWELLKKHKLPNLRLYNLPKGTHGKKEALQYGIGNSKGDLIITTDADCTHHKQWLETLISFYLKHKPKLIIAPVLMEGGGFFGQIQALDFFSLVASGGGASGIGKPIMCNGANLAFEKEVFEEFTDPHNKSFSSGDDVFLLLNIKKKYPQKIRFLKSKKVLVYTKAEKTIIQFIKQRKRWASKSTGYKDTDILTASFAVFFVNLSLAINLIVCVFFPGLIFLFLVQLFLKSLIDYSFLYTSLSFFNKTKLLWYFIPTQLANIILVPFIALAGILTSVKWKMP
jgi:cellulose synthase/poly-beta-1,6-N-acetylglucosamine synthase-like glycosyltransferase